MQFTCAYQSGNQFGTGSKSWKYSTEIKADGEDFTIHFQFKDTPHGKSTTGYSLSYLEYLSVTLSREEALKIASVILAQVHHPRIHSKSVKWMNPEQMPLLEKNRWVQGLHVEFDYYKENIIVKNETKYHIGAICINLTYQILNSENEYEEKTSHRRKLLDLPPGCSITVEIDKNDVNWRDGDGHYEFLTVSVSKVTGIGKDDSF
jgi:hypothetical protein